MSHCSNPFSGDLLEFLMKRRHLKNLKKSANYFIKNKKIQYNDEKTIDSNIDLLRKFKLRNMFLNNKFAVEILLHLSSSFLNNFYKTDS